MALYNNQLHFPLTWVGWVKYHVVLIVYQLLMLMLLPVTIVVLLLRSISQPAYRQRIVERLGFYNQNVKPKSIMVHGASVGEVLALKPFIHELQSQFPKTPITITTFTPTGSAQVKQIFADQVQHCYLPLDNPMSVRLFLARFKPQVIVLMETELWPTLLHTARSQNINLLLINGRISARSLPKYQKIYWLVKPVLACFNAILAQDETSRANLIALGAKPELIEVSGNLKFDLSVNDSVQQKISQLQREVTEARRIWVVGSSHEVEEQFILTSFKQVQQQCPNVLLVLVPRHPERFDKLASICRQNGFSLSRRSAKQTPTEKTDIWLVDSLGELIAFYAIADVCTIAGSFGQIGGHNPLEPALFAKASIVGCDMANFHEITQQLVNAKGLVQLTDNELLASKVVELLNNKQNCIEIGNAAFDVVRQNQGATNRSVHCLKQLIANQQN